MPSNLAGPLPARAAESASERRLAYVAVRFIYPLPLYERRATLLRLVSISEVSALSVNNFRTRLFLSRPIYSCT